jgi:hypothetical protein
MAEFQWAVKPAVLMRDDPYWNSPAAAVAAAVTTNHLYQQHQYHAF